MISFEFAKKLGIREKTILLEKLLVSIFTSNLKIIYGYNYVNMTAERCFYEMRLGDGYSF